MLPSFAPTPKPWSAPNEAGCTKKFIIGQKPSLPPLASPRWRHCRTKWPWQPASWWSCAKPQRIKGMRKCAGFENQGKFDGCPQNLFQRSFKPHLGHPQFFYKLGDINQSYIKTIATYPRATLLFVRRNEGTALWKASGTIMSGEAFLQVLKANGFQIIPISNWILLFEYLLAKPSKGIGSNNNWDMR